MARVIVIKRRGIRSKNRRSMAAPTEQNLVTVTVDGIVHSFTGDTIQIKIAGDWEVEEDNE